MMVVVVMVVLCLFGSVSSVSGSKRGAVGRAWWMPSLPGLCHAVILHGVCIHLWRSTRLLLKVLHQELCCCKHECVHITILWCFKLFGKIPTGWITGPNAISICSVLRNLPSEFYSNWISLQPHQQWRRAMFSPHCQHMLMVSFLLVAISGVRWTLSILLCSSQMTSNVDHFSCIYWSIAFFLWEVSMNFRCLLSIESYNLIGSLSFEFFMYSCILVFCS